MSANVSKEDVIEYISNMTVLELSEFVKELEEKFKKECKAGAQVVSFTFPMRNTEPVKKYPVGSVGEKIFFYKI